jgi:hypothetical protein
VSVNVLDHATSSLASGSTALSTSINQKSRPRSRCEPKPGATMPASAATGSSAEASHGLRVGPHAGGHRSRERRRPARVTVPRHRSPPCGAGRRRHRAGCPPAR